MKEKECDHSKYRVVKVETYTPTSCECGCKGNEAPFYENFDPLYCPKCGVKLDEK